LDLTPVLDVRPFTSDLTGDRESGIDPHVWVDPLRMAEVVKAIADRLRAADPAHASSYDVREATTLDSLTELDATFRTALRTCNQHEIVTAHTAFAYLAGRYGLTQVGVTGLDPDNEPSPGHVAEVARYARSRKVQTVYFESSVDPKLAQTIASEVGARTAVLDPVEGVVDGDDYLTVMRRNAAALADGLGCR
jgi:zinc transport system substrate-binding protein